MIKLLGVFLATIFLLLGLIHVYWAFGGKGASESVLPSVDGKLALNPSPFLTILVALALFTAMFVILGQSGFLGTFIPSQFFYWGTVVISVMFLLRAIGEFRLVGFFKKINDTNFAYWDTYLFSPLCLLIAIMAFLILKRW
jgi:Protein of unknown function (DUF3995)